jgi:hypothetical protein
VFISLFEQANRPPAAVAVLRSNSKTAVARHEGKARMDDLFDSVHTLEQDFIEEGAKEGRR